MIYDINIPTFKNSFFYGYYIEDSKLNNKIKENVLSAKKPFYFIVDLIYLLVILYACVLFILNFYVFKDNNKTKNNYYLILVYIVLTIIYFLIFIITNFKKFVYKLVNYTNKLFKISSDNIDILIKLIKYSIICGISNLIIVLNFNNYFASNLSVNVNNYNIDYNSTNNTIFYNSTKYYSYNYVNTSNVNSSTFDYSNIYSINNTEILFNSNFVYIIVIYLLINLNEIFYNVIVVYSNSIALLLLIVFNKLSVIFVITIIYNFKLIEYEKICFLILLVLTTIIIIAIYILIFFIKNAYYFRYLAIYKNKLLETKELEFYKYLYSTCYTNVISYNIETDIKKLSFNYRYLNINNNNFINIHDINNFHKWGNDFINDDKNQSLITTINNKLKVYIRCNKYINNKTNLLNDKIKSSSNYNLINNQTTSNNNNTYLNTITDDFKSMNYNFNTLISKNKNKDSIYSQHNSNYELFNLGLYYNKNNINSNNKKCLKNYIFEIYLLINKNSDSYIENITFNINIIFYNLSEAISIENAKLENNLKSCLFNKIAHEIKTPLITISCELDNLSNSIKNYDKELNNKNYSLDLFTKSKHQSLNETINYKINKNFILSPVKKNSLKINFSKFKKKSKNTKTFTKIKSNDYCSANSESPNLFVFSEIASKNFKNEYSNKIAIKDTIRNIKYLSYYTMYLISDIIFFNSCNNKCTYNEKLSNYLSTESLSNNNLKYKITENENSNKTFSKKLIKIKFCKNIYNEIVKLNYSVLVSLIKYSTGNKSKILHKLEYDENVSKYVTDINPQIINQIMLNLVSNSVKFTKNGEIKIFCFLKDNIKEFRENITRVGNCFADYSNNNDKNFTYLNKCTYEYDKNKDIKFLIFGVKDSGIGMDKDLVNIFANAGSFYKNDYKNNFSDYNTNGSCLGLSLCIKLCEYINIDFLINSNKTNFYHGTIIYLVIPVTSKEESNNLKILFNTCSENFYNYKLKTIDNKNLNLFDTKEISKKFNTNCLNQKREVINKSKFNILKIHNKIKDENKCNIDKVITLFKDNNISISTPKKSKSSVNISPLLITSSNRPLIKNELLFKYSKKYIKSSKFKSKIFKNIDKKNFCSNFLSKNTKLYSKKIHNSFDKFFNEKAIEVKVNCMSFSKSKNFSSSSINSLNNVSQVSSSYDLDSSEKYIKNSNTSSINKNKDNFIYYSSDSNKENNLNINNNFNVDKMKINYDNYILKNTDDNISEDINDSDYYNKMDETYKHSILLNKNIDNKFYYIKNNSSSNDSNLEIKNINQDACNLNKIKDLDKKHLSPTNINKMDKHISIKKSYKNLNCYTILDTLKNNDYNILSKTNSKNSIIDMYDTLRISNNLNSSFYNLKKHLNTNSDKNYFYNNIKNNGEYNKMVKIIIPNNYSFNKKRDNYHYKSNKTIEKSLILSNNNTIKNEYLKNLSNSQKKIQNNFLTLNNLEDRTKIKSFTTFDSSIIINKLSTSNTFSNINKANNNKIISKQACNCNTQKNCQNYSHSNKISKNSIKTNKLFSKNSKTYYNLFVYNIYLNLKKYFNNNLILTTDKKTLILANQNNDNNSLLVNNIEGISYKKNIIMICDDSKIILNSLNKTLKSIDKIKENYDILRATDGSHLLSMFLKCQHLCENSDNNKKNNDFKQNPISVKLIITDENMEYINGSECIREIKMLYEKNKLKNLPKIMTLTAFEDDEIIFNLKKLGVDCVMHKPASKQKLIENFQHFNII